MFAKWKQRWRDTRTVIELSKHAERRALEQGQQHPGVEHYTLAALDLADGSARRVFQRVGGDPEAYRAALAGRHDAVLAAMGLDAGPPEAPPPQTAALLFDVQPSGQALMRTLPEVQRRLPAPLCGAHVLLAAASMAHGAAGRALAAIGIEAPAFKRAAEDELRALMARGGA